MMLAFEEETSSFLLEPKVHGHAASSYYTSKENKSSIKRNWKTKDKVWVASFLTMKVIFTPSQGLFYILRC